VLDLHLLFLVHKFNTLVVAVVVHIKLEEILEEQLMQAVGVMTLRLQPPLAQPAQLQIPEVAAVAAVMNLLEAQAVLVQSSSVTDLT
jgi:hypothetical protein